MWLFGTTNKPQEFIQLRNAPVWTTTVEEKENDILAVYREEIRKLNRAIERKNNRIEYLKYAVDKYKNRYIAGIELIKKYGSGAGSKWVSHEQDWYDYLAEYETHFGTGACDL